MRTLAPNHTVGSEPSLAEGFKAHSPHTPAPKRAAAETAKYPPLSFLSISSSIRSSFSK